METDVLNDVVHHLFQSILACGQTSIIYQALLKYSALRKSGVVAESSAPWKCSWGLSRGWLNGLSVGAMVLML